jgi:hypothetical protein
MYRSFMVFTNSEMVAHLEGSSGYVDKGHAFGLVKITGRISISNTPGNTRYQNQNDDYL